MDVIDICHFGLFFVLLPPLQPKKSKFKKMKKILGHIIILEQCIKNDHKLIISCTVPEIWCATDGWTERWTSGRTDGSNK